MIKICAFSDGHGYLPTITEPFDLLLMGGDNVALNMQSSKINTILWYQNEFVNWVNTLPFNDSDSKLIFICGNHEVGFQKLTEQERFDLTQKIKERTNHRVVYLQNEQYVFWKGEEHIKIFGTPYCKIFGHWAYMETQENLTKLFSEIPDDCDILLTHDAPHGTSDLCYGWQAWNKPLEHVGSPALRDAILEKKPKYNLHGHLHSTNHAFEQLVDTKVTCISLLDESYKNTYVPLYLEF